MMSVETAPSTFFICPILCCSILEGPEWEDRLIIVTGHEDGIVNFWSVKTEEETPIIDIGDGIAALKTAFRVILCLFANITSFAQ